MTRSKLLADVASTLFLGAVLFYLWRPEYYQVAIAAGVVSIATTIYAAFRATPADRAHGRRAAWLIPVATLVIAAQMIYLATPEDRVRAMLLGAGLVVVGLVIYVLRRRVT